MIDATATSSSAVRATHISVLAVCFLGSLLALAPAAAQTPPLWGYGVRGCTEVVQACATDAAGAGSELQHYQDWLSGFLSGLNLATGIDVLAGTDIDAALQRACAHCKHKPTDDFFNAAMALVRAVGALPRTQDD